ncbi:MAG: MarR family transcriptional regulator [Tissierella sp.]|nr:MarR family transcriptional regulator [Tissierella sp.]
MVEREVAMQLKGIQHKVGQMMQQKIEEYGLTFGHLHLMMSVEKYPDKNQKFFAKEMRLTEGAISGMVKHLLKSDMLEQIPLETDMRFNRLVLTEKGQLMIDDCKEDLYVKYRDMFTDFSEDELIELNRYLSKINKNLDSMNKLNNEKNL